MSEKRPDLSSLNLEQQLFFQAAGKYPVSVTAQGIELYFLCKAKRLHYEDVYDSVMAGRDKLIALTSSIHQQLAQRQPGAEGVSVTLSSFTGILSSVISITEALFEAEDRGKPVNPVKLKQYLDLDYKNLRSQRDKLKSEYQIRIDREPSGDRKINLKQMLQSALSKLENDFNIKVMEEAKK